MTSLSEIARLFWSHGAGCRSATIRRVYATLYPATKCLTRHIVAPYFGRGVPYDLHASIFLPSDNSR
jgi:hypothetical protein